MLKLFLFLFVGTEGEDNPAGKSGSCLKLYIRMTVKVKSGATFN